VVDELPNPAEEKRRALREVVKVADDQYVELAREKTDKIFVILAEFGDTRHAGYPDQDTNKNGLAAELRPQALRTSIRRRCRCSTTASRTSTRRSRRRAWRCPTRA
jgi:hypothetical protein